MVGGVSCNSWSHENHKVLLTADAGPEALAEAANFVYLPARKAHPTRSRANPASRKPTQCHTGGAERVAGRAERGGKRKRGHAYVMVGAKKPDHPRKKVKNAFIRRGYPVSVGRTGWMRLHWGFGSRGVAVDDRAVLLRC